MIKLFSTIIALVFVLAVSSGSHARWGGGYPSSLGGPKAHENAAYGLLWLARGGGGDDDDDDEDSDSDSDGGSDAGGGDPGGSGGGDAGGGDSGDAGGGGDAGSDAGDADAGDDGDADGDADIEDTVEEDRGCSWFPRWCR